MASIPHFYSDYQFSTDEFSDISSVIAHESYSGGCVGGGGGVFAGNDFNSNNGGSMLGHPSMFYSGGEFEGYPSEAETFSRVPVNIGYFSDQFGGVSETAAAVPCSSNNSSSFYGFGSSNIAGGCCKVDQNNYSGRGSGGFQFSDGSSCEYGDDCCGFVPNFKSVCPELAGDNWAIQCNQMPSIEHSSIKVGRYSVEERKDRILKYLKKRNQRNFNKTIKYACRKTLADRRVRVRGRFARNNNELSCEDESGAKKNDNSLQDKESYSNDSLEMKNEDDDWLQEAVASLMYVPYIAGS